VNDVPANELTQPPLSRHTLWERRSSHVPLTAPGTTVATQAGDDSKQQDETSLAGHRVEQASRTDVSSACGIAVPICVIRS
jgi:hypothetical protein